MKDETEETPLDKIDRAIERSSAELRRLSLLYKLRGKSREAQKIDETLGRLTKHAPAEQSSEARNSEDSEAGQS